MGETVGATGSFEPPADTSETDKRERIKAYFSGQFHEQHRRWRILKQWAQGALLVLGGALWLITLPLSLYRAYELTQAESSETSLFEVGVIIGGIFLAGGALIVVARWNRLWQLVLTNPQRVYCWLVLAPAALIAAWVVKRHFGFSDLWQRGLGAVALAFLGIGFAFRTHELPPEEQMERDLDTWLEEDIARHIAAVGRFTRFAGNMPETYSIVLKGFPNLGRRPGVTVAARIGHDNRPRLTPAGFTLLAFTHDVALSFEGAIDLTTGELLYYRMHEFAYADIAVLGISSDIVEPDTKPDGGARMLPSLPLGVGRARLRHRDVFRIGLTGGTNIEVVLRDSGFRETWTRETEPLNPVQKVEEAWAVLSERRLHAQGRAAAGRA